FRSTLLIALTLGLTSDLQHLQAAPPQKAPSSTQTGAGPVDGGWPRVYNLASGGAVTIYQPQVESWKDQKHIVAWSAVSYQAKDAKEPALGTIKIEADTQVALDKRLVDFDRFQITEFNFSSLSRDRARTLVSELRSAVPSEERVIALDRVLADVEKSQI